MKKTKKQKISWHCPFKSTCPSYKYFPTTPCFFSSNRRRTSWNGTLVPSILYTKVYLLCWTGAPNPRAGSFSLKVKQLLILRGGLSTCQERRYYCVHKRGNPLYKYRGFDVYSMNKTGDRSIMFITRASATSWLGSCTAPSQAPWGWFCCITVNCCKN